ncbi:DMT family transporter [Klebsiella pneumoniae]|uniref:DMT family transporter n=1 Tax=Klebsiella pneumoniae TaxID=573 RepID=UPI002164D966|nr:multidrug efflux SMR transporter [Klebsiella pneumoniae]
MPAFEWVHVQLHQQKGMISLSPPTICNSASIFCLTFIGVSMYFLSLATRTIPVGTAYAVWVGIGALGTAAYGIIYLNEDKGLLRIACFGLILAGIIGLKILAGHKQL